MLRHLAQHKDRWAPLQSASVGADCRVETWKSWKMELWLATWLGLTRHFDKSGMSECRYLWSIQNISKQDSLLQQSGRSDHSTSWRSSHAATCQSSIASCLLFDSRSSLHKKWSCLASGQQCALLNMPRASSANLPTSRTHPELHSASQHPSESCFHVFARWSCILAKCCQPHVLCQWNCMPPGPKAILSFAAGKSWSGPVAINEFALLLRVTRCK